MNDNSFINTDLINATAHPSVFSIPAPPKEDLTVDLLNTYNFDRTKIVKSEIDITTDNYSLFRESSEVDPTSEDLERMIGLQTTKFVCVYMAKNNRELIKKMIRYRVYKRINKVVGYFNTGSDDIELMIVMKSILLQYSIFPRDCDTILFMDELRKLNEYVVRYFATQVISSIQSQMEYLYISSQPPTQLPVPVSTTIKGEKETRSTMDVLNGDPFWNPL